jgi:hypothetical protein
VREHNRARGGGGAGDLDAKEQANVRTALRLLRCRAARRDVFLNQLFDMLAQILGAVGVRHATPIARYELRAQLHP